MIAFTIPGPPQGKQRPRATTIHGHARLYTPAKTVAYESLVAHAAQLAMAGRPLLEGAAGLGLTIDCAIPASWSQRKRRAALAGGVLPTTKPDVDNVIKAICDGCNGVLWRDDVLVTDGHWRKRYAEVPCVRVEVWPVATWAADPQRAQQPDLLGEVA